MDGLTVRLDGGRQLRKGLAGVEGGLDDLKSAHREAAGIAARASSQLAPKKSGKLAGTIRAAGTKTAGIIRSGTKRVPYAGPIHWGWAARNIKGSFFLSDGARNTEGQWIRVYEDHLTELIDRI